MTDPEVRALANRARELTNKSQLLALAIDATLRELEGFAAEIADRRTDSSDYTGPERRRR